MCTCNCDKKTTEEYHTAYSDFDLSSNEDWHPEDFPPQDWRTSTRYEPEAKLTTTPRRIPRRDPYATRTLPPRTTTRRLNLSAGVAIVPRRIDFHAVSDEESDEDLGEIVRDDFSNGTRLTHVPESTAASRTFTVGRERQARHLRRAGQYTTMDRTPCGQYRMENM